MRISIPSVLGVNGARGRLFKHASIISSYVNLTLVVTLFKCALKLFTAASHKPPRAFRNEFPDDSSRRAKFGNKALNSLLIKKIGKLFQFSVGAYKVGAMIAPDHRGMTSVKRLRAAMNDSAVRSEINSK